MSDNEKTIVEINGVRLEVDLRTAKVIEQYKIGDRIKVLVKKYSNTFESHSGMIIGFDNFVERPTIIIAYIDYDYSKYTIKTVCFNKDTSDMEITLANETELKLKKEDIIGNFNDQKRKLRMQIEDIENQEAVFLGTFGKTFKG